MRFGIEFFKRETGNSCLSLLPWSAESLRYSRRSTLALSTIIQSDFAGIPVNLATGSAETVSDLLRVLDMSPILGEGDYTCF